MQQAADYIAQVMDRLSALAENGAIPIALSGGLSQALTPYLSARHQAQISLPQYSPLQGALLVARKINAPSAQLGG